MWAALRFFVKRGMHLIFDDAFLLVIISIFLVILVSIQYTLNKILVEIRDIRKNSVKNSIKNSESK